MQKRPAQLELALPKRGGRRPGAGRPRTRPHPGLIGKGVSHLQRAEFAARNPVHITQRMRPGVGHLRTQSRFALIQSALRDASDRFGMRVVHFSVQGNHLHLIVEADGRRALSRAMKGLAVRIAVGLNRLAKRRGTVFADRYHAHVLATPREVANAVRYVLQNHAKHARRPLPARRQDPFATSVAEPLHPPKVWLLRIGWTRAAEFRMAALARRRPGGMSPPMN